MGKVKGSACSCPTGPRDVHCNTVQSCHRNLVAGGVAFRIDYASHVAPDHHHRADLMLSLTLPGKAGLHLLQDLT